MAIKGKKKSGSRGSQARRRPAAAPRPVVGATRQKTPWYNTAAGRVIAALLVVLLIAGIGTLIAVNRSNAREQEERRETVERYVNEVKSAVQSAAPAAAQMSAIAPGVPEDQLETLAEDAEGWATEIEAAASRVVAIQAPEEVASIHPYFTQAFQLYSTNAKLLIDAADAEGKAQADLLTRATEIRSNAEGVWAAATAQLDTELGELGGDPSGLLSPATAGATATVPTTPSGGGGQGGGGGGQGGGQGQGENANSDGG
jgi:hypothetical protein